MTQQTQSETRADADRRLRELLSGADKGEPLVQVKETISRRDGTMNILVAHAKKLAVVMEAPKAKNWG